MNNKEVIKFGNAHEYSGFWVRAGAAIIDSIILLIITTPIMLMLYGDKYWLSGQLFIGFGDFLFNIVFPFLATVLFWVYKSATPGKMIVKAQVVDAETGSMITVKQSIIRYLGYLISVIPFGLGIFWVAWDSKKQGWHDKLAGTVVIHPKDKGLEQVKFSTQ